MGRPRMPVMLLRSMGTLEQFAGVEGGVWKTGSGSIAYAFPTYQGSGQKPIFPQSEDADDKAGCRDGRDPRTGRSNGSGMRVRRSC